MKVHNFSQVSSEPVQMEGADGVSMQVLLGPKEGAPHFIMRRFEVSPGGHTPHHHHPYEHQVYVLDGHGQVVEGEGELREIGPGDCVFVPADEPHQFRNTGSLPLRFLCMIPKPDDCGL